MRSVRENLPAGVPRDDELGWSISIGKLAALVGNRTLADAMCLRPTCPPEPANAGAAIWVACILRGMRLPAGRVARMGAAAGDRWPSLGTLRR